MEELLELHDIYCPCERCAECRALEKERNRLSVYFRSPAKRDKEIMRLVAILQRSNHASGS